MTPEEQKILAVKSAVQVKLLAIKGNSLAHNQADAGLFIALESHLAVADSFGSCLLTLAYLIAIQISTHEEFSDDFREKCLKEFIEVVVTIVNAKENPNGLQ